MAIELDHTDPDHEITQSPMMADGILYLPSSGIGFLTAARKGSDGRVGVIAIDGTGGMGLCHAMTTATMRTFAAQMMASADEIEGVAKDMAEGHIGRIMKGGAA